MRVHRVVSAVDIGQVVNPSGVEAQVEGSIVFGLSAALYGEISIRAGAVEQSNFHDYPVLRIDEMPEVEVHIIESDADPADGRGCAAAAGARSGQRHLRCKWDSRSAPPRS